MKKIILKPRAKINLNLIVLDKRKDNYHNIKSIFQKISLCDKLIIKKNKKNECNIISNVAIEKNENIIYKCYIELKNIYKQINGVDIILQKNIPMQAGLGGGSSDCASFIIGMNKLFKLNLTNEQIISLAKKLGSDVTPCLYNQPVLAEGIGDIITKLNTNFKYYLVIIKPKVDLSTKAMYQKLDSKQYDKIDTTDNIIAALRQKDVYLLSNNLFNSFEVLDNSLIKMAKDLLIKNGAINSLLSGSGSCVYGIYRNKRSAKKAYKILKKDNEAYLCYAYNAKEMFYEL